MQRIHVYCDETGTHGGARKYVIGSLWMPRKWDRALSTIINEVQAQARDLSEIKWTKTTRFTLPQYQEIGRATLNILAKEPRARYRAIVIDKSVLNHRVFNRGDPELGFYKFYWQLLFHEIECRFDYLRWSEQFSIWVDQRSDNQPARLGRLTHILRHTCQTRIKRCQTTDPIRQVLAADSKAFRVMQACDLITGAIGAECNRTELGEAKRTLLQFLCHQRTGRARGISWPASPPGRRSAFNVWHWRPSETSRMLQGIKWMEQNEERKKRS